MPPMNHIPQSENIQAVFAELGYFLSHETSHALCTYVTLLMRWNAIMNLVGTRTWQETCRKLIVDSLELAQFLPTLGLPQSLHTWDLGAGAGLPGIPLRTIWHDGTYTMLESREKRALFLENVVAQCSLPHTKIFQGRVEKYMQMETQKPDLIVSRAFMPWEKACIFMRPALHDASLMVFLLKQIPDIRLVPHATIYAHHTYTVDQMERVFVVIKQSCHSDEFGVQKIDA